MLAAFFFFFTSALPGGRVVDDPHPEGAGKSIGSGPGLTDRGCNVQLNSRPQVVGKGIMLHEEV